MKFAALVVAASSLPSVLGWGLVGHEIVATIAQMHLHPKAHDAMCSILPEYAKCNLAPVAAWADRFKYQMRWSSQMHYVNSVGDHPAEKCVFGEEGWGGHPGINVLSAIRNTTMWLEKGYDGAEEALKFLIHFVGDLHQPLHLTGRDRGGNGDKVRFNHRVTNLHSVWDTLLIAKSILNTPRNYTDALPDKYVEDALFGKAYDPYVRQIMHEGLMERFQDEIDEWLACPNPDSFSSSRLYPPTERMNQLPLVPSRQQMAHLPSAEGGKKLPVDDVPPTDDSILCPFAWAKPMHQLNCDIVWPLALDDPDRDGYLELDTDEYSGKIKQEWIIEKQLAMGGIRLAAILNYLFASDEVALYRAY